MKKYWIITIMLLVFAPLMVQAGVAEHPQGCSGNCLDCHKADKQDAEAVVKKLKEAGNLPPNAEITDMKCAPAGGMWEIDLEANGRKGMVYLDFSKKYIIPQLIPIEAIKKPEPRKIDFSKIPLKDALVLGPKGAKKKVVVFTDPDCPYCRKLHEELREVLSKRNDVAFYLVLFPLSMHKDAYPKVQSILCERSLNLVDAAFAGKAVPEAKCGKEAVERNIALAAALQVTGTPTLVREDGVVLSGVLPTEKLVEWIDGK